MAARKHPAKPRGASRTSAAPARKTVPGWVWLVAGAAIGGFFVFLAQLKPGSDEVKRAAAGKPESTASAAKPAAPAQPATPPKPKYDFYTLLPESSNSANLLQAPPDDQARAAEAARAQALLDGRTPPPRLVMAQPAAAKAAPTTPPAPTAAAPAPAPAAAGAPTASATPAAAKPAPAAAGKAPATAAAQNPSTPPPAAPQGTRFVLQAGSFASREQADSARAKLSLLGQNVRVESGKVGDKTWHRVVVGPFASRQQADAAQKQLSAGGVSSVLQQRR